MKRIIFGVVGGIFIAAIIYRSNRIQSNELLGTYCAKYAYGVDKIQIKEGGTFYQLVLLIEDSSKYEASGQWRFDPSSDYISIENRLLISDGFGKLRGDFPKSPKGTSVLPVRRKYFLGEVEIGSTELVPYVKASDICESE